MVEGSLWVYAKTRLSDYYSGDLSLRELLNRFHAMPYEAPIWRVLEAEDEKAQGRKKAADIEALMTKFQKAEVNDGR